MESVEKLETSVKQSRRNERASKRVGMGSSFVGAVAGGVAIYLAARGDATPAGIFGSGSLVEFSIAAQQYYMALTHNQRATVQETFLVQQESAHSLDEVQQSPEA